MNDIAVRRTLVIIVILSFALSLAYSFLYRITPLVDAQAYDRIAVNIVGGQGFREDATKDFVRDTAIIRAGPAYEYMLAGLYAVFGHHVEIVWTAQALLHALTALLIFFAARSIFDADGAAVGLIASAFIGLHPDLIEISAMLMTETLYLFLVALVLRLFAGAYHAPGRFAFAAALGVASGFAILSRPPMLLFLPVLLFFYAARKQYMQGLVLLALVVAVLLPWTVRNAVVFRQFIPTTLIGGYNLWVGNMATSDGGQISGGYNPATTYTDANGFAQFKDVASDQFFFTLLAHPLRFIKLTALRAVRYMSLIRPMGFWFYQTGWKQMLFVASSLFAIALLFVAGCSGMLLSLRDRNTLYYYLVALTLLAPVALLPAVVESRYRFQIYPFLALFAGYFIVRARQHWPSVRQSFVRASGILFIGTSVDVLLSSATIIKHIRSLL